MPGDIEDRTRAFIGDRFPDVEFANGDDIFALGFVNSLFAMELVLFVESTFAITVANDELRLDNFRSVDSMAALVRRQSAVTSRG